MLTDDEFQAWLRAAQILGEAWQTYGELRRSAGYADGYARGFEAGQRARDDEYDEWFGLAKPVYASPTTVELEARRMHTNEPCQLGCGSCSRCIRSGVATRNLEIYGQPDLPGVSA